MNISPEVEKGWEQHRMLFLISGLLVLGGLCLIVYCGGLVWMFQNQVQSFSANKTATAVGLSTEQAWGTATMQVRATELAQYEFFDTFDSDQNKWTSGFSSSGTGWDGNLKFREGVFVWNITDVYWDYALVYQDFAPPNDFIKNYDAYVETKMITAPSGNACSGMLFRKAPLGWDTGGYAFFVCMNGYYYISYYNYKNGWQEISSQPYAAIRPDDWNRLAIQVTDSRFVFLVNDEVVCEATDDEQRVGGVALAALVSEEGSRFLFDNFGLQTR